MMKPAISIESGTPVFHRMQLKSAQKEDATPHHGRDLINLNVGGTRFTTFYNTLLNARSSYFENFICGDGNTGVIYLFEQRVIVNETGAVFINRDGLLFSYVLQFMRDRQKCVLPADRNILEMLMRESEFFGIESFKNIIIERLRSIEKEI
ncbi:unnamed protein product [Caenorhabditis bovis]|uniref:Potassium channel tetramerisation-type BTB domain-containing protein n=1 Tax=Caenorhabditis bovis TaxID=2654633 RepID=A0A8S1EID4_9PELO|nr:unnamed protein product [Caenorhabditis bovis]